MADGAADPFAPWLTSAELRRLARIDAMLPRAWTRSVRRRRLLLLALAAPGFLATAATSAHQNVLVLIVGLTAFAAAFVFRRLTEPVFVRAEAAALWPPLFDPLRPHARKDSRHV